MKLSIASRRRASAGFTLIELMATVLIAAILVAIAGPMYTNQIRHSRRTDARTALLDLASREERFFSTNSAYTSTLSQLGYAGTAWPVNVGSNYYQITACVGTTTTAITPPCAGAAAGTGAAFVLIAVPINAQTKDTICGSFTLDNTGVQNVTGTASATPQTCWSQ